jgi:hypothetical protein
VAPADPWVPFYARETEAGATAFDSLFPGVPAWMRESLWGWLNQRLSRPMRSSARGSFYWDPDPESIREVERICRVDSGWDGSAQSFSSRVDGLQSLRAMLYKDEKAFLTAVDFHLSRTTDAQDIQELERILEDSSSKWRVGQVDSRPALVERVDRTVQQVAEQTAGSAGRSGRLLAEAWRHAFSMQRNPSSAYRCAVRAVEASAAPIFTPTDPQPSLGKMSAALRDSMAKWRFAFTVDSKVDPKEVLLGMMQLPWTNDYARHIDADPDVPLNVSQQEAESAVILALTLINWFTSGAVARV